MGKSHMLNGSIVALVSPMQENGCLDLLCFKKLIDWHIEQGSQAIVVAGTTGEAATLEDAEMQTLFQHAVKHVNGRIGVIAGISSNATNKAVKLAVMAKNAGVDAGLVVTPYFNKPSAEGIHAHYVEISKTQLPLLIYNVPGRTACNLSPQTISELATIPGIIGIKDANGDIARVSQIKSLCGENFLFFSGDDATACEAILRGADGVISVTANVVPDLMRSMCNAALANQSKAARAIDTPLQTLHLELFLQGNPIPVKWVLHELALIPAGIHLPLTRLRPEFQQRLRLTLNKIFGETAAKQAI